MFSSELLKGKRAFITGSNRGIGKAILELFALNGASIYACARRKNEEFEGFLEDLKTKFHSHIEPMYFDLTNELEIKDCFRKLFLEKVSIDILVNNAGVAHGDFLQMTSIKKIKEVFDINFFSQLLITQNVSKFMIRQKRGSIINMASVVGIDAHPGYSAYGSSKAALIYATKTLSKELASYNIRVNAIAPGLIETDMADQMEVKAKEFMIADNSMKRLGSPEEIANIVLFLASDLSSFVNGQVIRVDGGI